MMTFSPKTRRSFRRSSERKRRVVVGGLIVLAVLSAVFLSGILGSGLSYITSPLRSFSTWMGESSGTIPSHFRSQQALIDQIQTLEERAESQDDLEAKLLNLEKENRRLRELLGSSEIPRIAAGVIMRPGDTPYDTLLIDRGSQDGILEGAVVFADFDTVIGTVSRVFPKSALVSLVSSPGQKSTVYIYGPDIFTYAEGFGGGVLRVSVPQGIELAVGNPVVLPTIDPGVYGTITHIESLESSPAQYGFVTSPTSINSLRFVAVSSEVPPEITFADALQHVENMRVNVLTTSVPQEILISTTSATSTEPIRGI